MKFILHQMKLSSVNMHRMKLNMRQMKLNMHQMKLNTCTPNDNIIDNS